MVSSLRVIPSLSSHGIFFCPVGEEKRLIHGTQSPSLETLVHLHINQHNMLENSFFGLLPPLRTFPTSYIWNLPTQLGFIPK